jgi:glycolate oxidase iron-sulfur subunit
MDESLYLEELSKCVRCGACKAMCPTYLTTMNETMGARGRVAMLGELGMNRLAPNKRLAEKIFSCMLCGACKNLCPTGIDIPEIIYQGRVVLRNSFRKGLLFRAALKYSVSNTDAFFNVLRGLQKLFYQPFSRIIKTRYFPEISPRPFRNSIQVYKNIRKISRVALFTGCSVNYFYPNLGKALSGILLSKGYEVVVFKGESCCGAPLRSFGLQQEALTLAKRNIEHFNKVRAEAIISMCPTCTMVIKEQYPVLTGDTILNIMDVNEFLIQSGITSDLKIKPRVVTYHDPCHLNYGLGVNDKPRQILKGIKGVEFIEMQDADECCGFAGVFSFLFKDISNDIGKKKIENISNSTAETVVTSCPGCIMQLQALKRENHIKIKIKHIVELIDEALHTY